MISFFLKFCLDGVGVWVVFYSNNSFNLSLQPDGKTNRSGYRLWEVFILFTAT